jgi:cation:H+ antiporter
MLSRSGLDIQILHISIYTPLIVVLYLVAMRAAFVYEARTRRPPVIAPSEGLMTLRQAVLRYALAASVVAIAGTWLPFIGNEIADAMGWQTTFVGTLLIAGATSIPELVITVTALRLGAVDMAIGNLLGSNLFNILILAIDDFAYVKAPLLSFVSPAHAISAFAAVIMSGIFIVALLYQPETRMGGIIGWVSLSLLAVYLLSSYAIFLHGH